MKKFYLFITVWIFIPIIVFAQHSIPKIGKNIKSSNLSKEGFAGKGVEAEYLPLLQNNVFHPAISHKISKNESEKEEVITARKLTKTLAKKNHTVTGQEISGNNQGNEGDKVQSTSVTQIATQFETHSNLGGGCPSDNTVAVGSGYVVVAINSTLEYYTVSGNYINQIDLAYLFQNLNLPSYNLCDPKLMYDSYSHRFVLYTQVCDGVSYNSRVLVAVSQTNDPTQGWWIQSFSGNPLNDNSWFDFPKLSVSMDYVFITGNLFYQNGGFNQSVIYRIDKNNLYNGQSANYWYWYNLNAFTILPIGFGQDGVLNTDSYIFIATDAGQSSRLRLFQIDVDGSGNVILNDYDYTIDAYDVSGNAYQNGTSHILHTGDCRIADGFYLNNLIHFVHCSDYNNYSCVRYYRFDPLANTYNVYTTFADGLDYAYPSIASFSTSLTDKTAIINFFRSGASIYPEIRFKVYDDAGNTNGSVQVRAGDFYVDGCYDPNKQSDRWGDYSGFARYHYSGSPNVWLSGSYGRYVNGTGKWGNYVAQIVDWATGIEDKQPIVTQLSTNPNPVTEKRTELIIQSENKESIRIEITDIQGKVLYEIYRGVLLEGENRFSCDTNPLSLGIYLIKVTSVDTGNLLASQKIVIQP